MRKYILPVSVAALSLLLFACGGDSNPVASLTEPVVVASTTTASAELKTPNPCWPRCATPTTRPAPTATSAPAATATSTTAPTPAPTPTSAPVNNENVIKMIGPAPCLLHASWSGVINYYYIVDGPNAGITVDVSLVWSGVSGDVLQRDPLGLRTAGGYPTATTWPASHPAFMWLEGTSGGGSYYTDRCAIVQP